MVPVRKFSSTTSLFLTSRSSSVRPSGALRLSVTLCLLRLTARKYVASPPTNGGHERVSSPLPGSSILITSAPMSPRIIEQKGPASTRVRSSTRIPDSGRSARGTMFPLPHPLGEAAGDRVHAVAGAAGAAPEQARAVQGAEAREVIDVVDRLDGDGRPDLQPFDLGAVTDEARAAVELHDGEVQR